MSKRTRQVIISLATLALVAAMAAPAALADSKPGLQVHAQPAGNSVQVTVVNSSSVAKSAVVSVDVVVNRSAVRALRSVKVAPNSSTSVSVGFGGGSVSGVISAGIVEAPDPT